MRSPVWQAVIVGILVAGCGPAPKSAEPETSPTQDRSAIDRTRSAYEAAWMAANVDEVADLYTDDAVVLYPNQPAISGKSEIVDYFRSFFREYVQDSFTLTSAEIEIAGPWAFDRGTYRWKRIPRNGGNPIEDRGKYLIVLRRQADGSWKVARDMDNSDRPQEQSTRSSD